MTAYLAALAEAAESDRMRRWLAAAMEARRAEQSAAERPRRGRRPPPKG